MNNDDIKNHEEFILPDNVKEKDRYKNILKKALELFNKEQAIEFIDTYNKEFATIDDKIDAIAILLIAIIEKENYNYDKILKFKKSILKTANKEFGYLYDNAMFHAGIISPEELIQSIEAGIKHQIPLAYAIKAFFYYCGIDIYESSLEAIQKAIMLEPSNLEYQKILKDLENEKTN